MTWTTELHRMLCISVHETKSVSFGYCQTGTVEFWILTTVASSMSFGFPGYRQQCFITCLANIYVLHVTCNLYFCILWFLNVRCWKINLLLLLLLLLHTVSHWLFPLPALDLGFSRSNFETAVAQELLFWLVWSEKEVDQLDTGLATWSCPLAHGLDIEN